MTRTASRTAWGTRIPTATTFCLLLLGLFTCAVSDVYAQETDVDQHDKLGTIHNHGETDHGQSDAYWAERASGYLPFLVDEEEARYVPVEQLNALGVWGPVINWPHIPVSAANLPDGRILSFSSNKVDAFPVGPEYTYAATWTPGTTQFDAHPHTSHDMFCGHLVMLDDGRVFINGGRNTVRTTSVFDATTNSWSVIEPMVDPRWYPTTIALPNGEVFTASGNGGPNTAERWTPNQGWQKLNGINWSSIAGANGFESHWWPYLFINNDGTLFHAGPTDNMHTVDTDGNGTLTNIGTRLNDNWYPKHAAVVMYAPGKILIAGGSVQHSNAVSTNRALTIDINGPTPVVTEIAPMAHARRFNSAVMLPNGEVMVIGGNTSGVKFSDQGTVLPTEIWNPTTGQWRTVASISVPRNYHSIALLLPDAQVLSAGGGLCGNCAANHQDGQVYTPAYLFNPNGSPATRPAINQAPAAVNHNQTFTVQATAGVTQFSLIKLSATTHAVNTDLRYMQVPFTTSGNGTYSLTAHANPNVLTAGYYMLFALDAQGVPSVAHTLRVNPPGTNGAPVLTHPGNQNGVVGAAVNLTLTATDPDGHTLTFSATNLPPDLSLNPATGQITGTLTTANVYTTTATVDDGNGGSAAQTFTWTVSAANAPPELTNPGAQTNQDGDAVALALTATDPDGDPLTFSATGLPTGLTLDTNNGLISGIPTAATTANVTVTVADGNGGTDTEAFTWTIQAAPGTWLDFADETATRLTLASLPANDDQEKDLAVGDLNNDGWDDVVVVRKPPFMGIGGRKDALLMNNNGVLQDQTDQYAPAFSTHLTDARDVLIRDLNGDGWQDVVIATTFEDPPALYLNRGANAQGTWLGLADESARLPAMNVSPSQFCGVSSGDINADGHPDLYFSNYAPDGSAQDVLLINDGTGTFTDESDARLGNLRNVGFSTSAAWVDLDQDGDVDLIRHDDRAIQPFGEAGIYLFFNDGTGTFNTWQRLIGNAPYMFGVGDFNADNKQDLFVVDDGQDLVALTDNITPNTSLSFIERPLTSARTAGFGGNLSMADLDGDGDLDVGLADVDSSNPPCDTGASARKFALLQNDGTGQLTDPWGAATNAWNQNTFDFGFLDLDRDGDLDFFAAGCTGYRVYINTNTPANQPPALANPGSQTHTIGDAVDLTLSATDPDGDALTFTGSNVPAGLTLNPNTGRITGNPNTANTYATSITVNDGNGGTDTEAFTWTINPGGGGGGPECSAPAEVVALSDPSWSYRYFQGNVDPAATFTMDAGATGQNYFGEILYETEMFVMVDGTPQAGLPTTCAGLTPGAAYEDLEVVSAQQTTQADNTCGVRQVTLRFRAHCAGGGGNQPPVLANPGPKVNTVGDAVDLTLSATDADGDALTFSQNNLPSGLLLNANTGRITGSPNAPGAFAVSVTADDGNGGTDTEAFTWTINTEGGGGPECAAAEEVIILSDPGWSYRYFQGNVDPGDTFSIASAPTGQDFFGQAFGEAQLYVRVGGSVQAGIPTACAATVPGNVFDDLLVVDTREVNPGGGCALDRITLHFRPQCTGTVVSTKLAEETATLHQQGLPHVFALDAPYPNPFSYETAFPYALPEATHVRITLFNVMGQVVAELLDATQPSGSREVRWDGRDLQGRPVGTGVYFARMQAGAFVQTRKVMVQR